MKTIIALATTALFATSVNAAEIYNGFAQGNADLQSHYPAQAETRSASQPGIGSGFDRYHGFADGSSDLFSDSAVGSVSGNATDMDVYHGFAGNPDL